jgi:AcrR family transcriptional regulator
MGRNPEKNRFQLEQTRARLMKAGREVILEQGLNRIAVKDIVTRAKVGVGTFYFHFKDLEQFQNEVIGAALDEVRIKTRQIRGMRDKSILKDPEQSVRRGFEMFYDFIDQNDQVSLILMRERAGAGPLAELIRKHFNAFVVDLREDLEEAARYGLIAKDIPYDLVAEAILGMNLQLAESYAARRVAEGRAPDAMPNTLSAQARTDRERVIATVTRISLTGIFSLSTDNAKGSYQ